jgi:hypothetical protein
MGEAIEHQMAMIYEALAGNEFEGTDSRRRTADAARDAGLTLDQALDVLRAMAERGDEITSTKLKTELYRRAERAAFEADSDDGDAASED